MCICNDFQGQEGLSMDHPSASGHSQVHVRPELGTKADVNLQICSWLDVARAADW